MMKAVRLRYWKRLLDENDVATPNVLEKMDEVYIQIARRMIGGTIRAVITRWEPLEPCFHGMGP